MYEILTWLMLCVWAAYSLGRLLNRIIAEKERRDYLAEIVNNSYKPVATYKLGEMVYPDSFDDDRWNECSHGIHFFITRQEAVEY